MHEMAVTSAIVEALLDLAAKNQSSRVLEVHLRIGMLRALSVDQVKFSFDILTKGTILDGSKLLIEETPGKISCPACGYSKSGTENDQAHHFGIPVIFCPNCGGMLDIEGGDECTITKVRMLTPQRAQSS